MCAGRKDTHGVIGEQRRDLGGVRAELIVGTPERRPLVCGHLQLDDAERETVDEQHDVRTPGALISLHAVLVDGDKLIAVRLVEVHEPRQVVSYLAAVIPTLDGNAGRQELVDTPVLGEYVSALGSTESGDHVLDRSRSEPGVEAGDSSQPRSAK